jgi:hypothetical protein
VGDATGASRSASRSDTSAASAALTTSETVSRKLMPAIVPNDGRRARRQASDSYLVRFGARQSEPCDSAKTEVAATSSRTTPAIAATKPSRGLLALSSSFGTASAPRAHQPLEMRGDLPERGLGAEFT